MDANDGNIFYQRLQHTWQKGKCSICGANEAVYSRGDIRETYAYPFIHKPLKEIFNMTFDVITGRSMPFEKSITLYANKNIGYVSKDEITQNFEWVNKFKIFISRAYGAGEDFPHQIINQPIFGDEGTCCTETYMVIGPYDTKQETENVITYIKTKFFRFMVLLKKNTQDAPSRVYSFVPLQDFSHPLTDVMLYKKYGLTDDEIAFIESMIRPME